MSVSSPLIYWFRQDLRLHDNPAFKAAVESRRAIFCVYILDDETPGDWALGGASRWWLHDSLRGLSDEIAAKGGRLILRRGCATSVLNDLVRETGADAIFFSRCYEPHAVKQEHEIAAALAKQDVACRRFGGTLLFEPDAVLTRNGAPFKVFTPYYKACLAKGDPVTPLTAPERIDCPPEGPESDDLEDWGLLPIAPDWAVGLRETWTPGEAAAQKRLGDFLNSGIASYHRQRDRPDLLGTSRLSPHLHFGEISPRQCWHAATAFARAKDGPAESGVAAFRRELIWREFSYHLLYHFPTLPHAPFRREFENFRWNSNPLVMKRWQRGQTGFPIVDAGMRELWHTGWMHNRVRMITASFLVKDLLIPWQKGEAWFWDTLVDADLANNAASWQWVTGSGADAAPFFRVFNPLLQGEKFDPDGAYVKHWVPELASVPREYIHRPWEAPRSVLIEANVQLDDSYPSPIVDHRLARRRALSAFEAVKKTA